VRATESRTNVVRIRRAWKFRQTWTNAVPIDFGTTFYWTEEQEQQQASNLRPNFENR
jgi:hypothetical protein